ncbi:tubulin-specific chaperone cofactor E-like protein isoform X2 [Cephus cinctus]|nr:tubulin-specific chaperone cofactor E-like protein isoform X2 [Cephus cinctus]XP_015587642.1 tubulin-specific chaperone cofactor E-like protein isoform X2 [Cephus cinctus]XP_015587643.1 tubulin-specific chaperone cofactor E-like protein isoform X2 [Cephus cinctus]XP_024937365.1 tubulin-specific chaperone cofactor E-like protein isoform X2 [Cephus cinctus]XP_024937366.1 tubulin-specific chaperone cofactor E-like protein isoform X2 [Cephus cinctus]XP_024937367.1 tubulin-specific chaperone cof
MPSLLEALELKYGSSTTECSLTDEETALSVSIFVPKKSPRHTVPALLVLQDCDIESAGNDDEKLKDKCKNVEELDLAQNKLSQWNEVFGILQYMPKIKFVNLSFNSLTEILEVKHGSYDLLRNLVLNGTRVSWSTVQGLIRLLQNLEELHLSLNEYKTVDLEYQKEENRNASIKKLHFTGNPIEIWNEISKLGYVFPNLESLVLAECPIRSLTLEENRNVASNGVSGVNGEEKPVLKSEDNENMNLPEPESSEKCPENRIFSEEVAYNRTESECESSSTKIRSPHDPFRMLRFLNVNGTLLSTWDDVERLARFPAMKSLRMQGCPLFESPSEYTEHERRQLLIARLPNVETLNGGGVISSQEREDAERAFIRYYMDKPEADRPERYAELVGIHGKLDPLVHVDLTPEKRVKVTFTYGDLVEVRSVDVYRTVFELKRKLESMVKIPANRMRLFYVDQDLKSVHACEEMLYPNKQLYRYNIRTGGEIIIDSKLNRFVSTSSSTSSIQS